LREGGGERLKTEKERQKRGERGYAEREADLKKR